MPKRPSKKAKIEQQSEESKEETKPSCRGRSYIGTSGYIYKEWRHGVFYPEGLKQKDEFHYYASKFDTVEINNTFYRLPSEKTYNNWYDRAPPGFIYTLKVSRFMSHIKSHKDSAASWEKFWNGASILKNKLGPILWQMPESFEIDTERLANLAEFLPKNQRIAFEFRHSSWFHPSVYEILKKNKWALVILPPGKAFNLPCVEEVTSDFVYVRWHGATGKYEGSYSEEHLNEWAQKINKWCSEGIDVFGYFNNTDWQAAAAHNALALKMLLKE